MVHFKLLLPKSFKFLHKLFYTSILSFWLETKVIIKVESYPFTDFRTALLRSSPMTGGLNNSFISPQGSRLLLFFKLFRASSRLSKVQLSLLVDLRLSNLISHSFTFLLQFSTQYKIDNTVWHGHRKFKHDCQQNRSVGCTINWPA